MMKLSFGQEILVRNKKEADFIWKKLLSNGYEWNSHSKDFQYYKELPIIIHIRYDKKLTYSNYYYGKYEYEITYTIDDFAKKLDLE